MSDMSDKSDQGGKGDMLRKGHKPRGVYPPRGVKSRDYDLGANAWGYEKGPLLGGPFPECPIYSDSSLIRRMFRTL